MHVDTLVIGANSYLAQNLVARVHGRRLALNVRERPNAICRFYDHPLVVADLVEAPDPLLAVRPREVWLCARPWARDLPTQLEFAHQLKWLLMHYLDAGHLERVVLFSTQLVYRTPSDEGAIGVDAPIEPEAAYEYAKADLELFLGCLCRQYGLSSAEVIRLPLLFGGQTLAHQRAQQLSHVWMDAHRRGWRWPGIETAPPEHGTSWVDVEALASRMATDEWGVGLRIRNASSGALRYRALHDAAERWWGRGRVAPELWRPGSCFYLQDDMGLPQASFEAFVHMTTPLERAS